MACHIWSLNSQPTRSDYNGLGQRVSQEVSSVVTEYILDVQPGLYKVIAADDGTDVNRYIHDPVTERILQHEDPTGDWNWPALDGLGTVRGVYDDTLTEVYAADRDPYGDLITATGSNPTPFEYTGEPEDQNGLLHLRARYYDPGLAVFASQDPLEMPNRYAYVGGDPVNLVDHTGLYPCGRDQYDPNCQRLEQALNASSNMAAKQAIQNAIFPPYYDQGATCPSDPSDSLKALQDALESHFPIESIKTGSGGDGLQTSHRVVLLRLAEAVLLIDRRLSLNTALSNELNITFDNVNAPEFGGESGGYVAEQNTTDYPMQLGNLMSTDDIVHEWGHVFNRENGSFFSTRLSTVGKGVYVGSDRGDCALEDAVTPYPGGPTYRRYVISGIVAASPQNYRRCHVGYGHEANSSRDPIEDWPDMFMNWVFDGYSGAQAGFDKVADDVEAASARRHWVDQSLRLSGIT